MTGDPPFLPHLSENYGFFGTISPVFPSLGSTFFDLLKCRAPVESNGMNSQAMTISPAPSCTLCTPSTRRKAAQQPIWASVGNTAVAYAASAGLHSLHIKRYLRLLIVSLITRVYCLLTLAIRETIACIARLPSMTEVRLGR